MSKKKANIFEEHLDKIILGVFGLIGLALLWFFVLRNPYSVQISNQSLGPGDIDRYIASSPLNDLENSLERTAEPRVYAENRREDFAQLMENALPRVDQSIAFMLPSRGASLVMEDRSYALPQMPDLDSISVNRIRTVVFMPTEPVEQEHPYEKVETQLEDTDVITVQSELDIESLVTEFQQIFVRNVKSDWKDRSLAMPVFAGVDLERRYQQLDGSWSDWKDVPRSRIDSLRKVFDIPQETENLEYGVDLLRVQFGNMEIQKALLQPVFYDIAAANVTWFPPSLQDDYQQLQERQRREELMERRDEIERDRDRRGRGRRDQDRRDRDRTGGGGPMLPPGMEGYGMDMQDDRGRGRRGRGMDERDRRRMRRDEEVSMRSLQEQLMDITIDVRDQYDDMESPLVFWAHDDTARPGRTYQYRMRVGVFNPVAGKNWLDAPYQQYNDDVILWSGYSPESEPVEIPDMMHFFPLNVAMGQDSSVQIEVAKFYKGQWQSEQFTVRPGEQIGGIVEKTIEDDDRNQSYNDNYGDPMMMGMEPGYREDREPETVTIDYTTGAVLVDIKEAQDWSGANVLHSREYTEILYTDDEETIKHLPVRTRYWPKGLQTQYAAVQSARNEEVEIVEERGKSKTTTYERDPGRMYDPYNPYQDGGPGPIMPPGMSY